MDYITNLLQHLPKVPDAVSHAVAANAAWMELLSVLVAVGLGLLVFRWPYRAWGVVILVCGIIGVAYVVVTKMLPRDEQGAQPFSVSVPALFSVTRLDEYSFKASDEDHESLRFMSGNFQDDTPDSYTAKHCVKDMNTFKQQIASDNEIESADLVRQTLRVLSQKPDGDYCVISWDQTNSPHDNYEVFVAVPSTNGQKGRYAHLHLITDKDSTMLSCRDYQVMRDSLINSAKLTPPGPCRHP